MARKRKAKKRKRDESEFYEVELEDWEIDYSFGVNRASKVLIGVVYSEYSTVILKGKILSPVLKQGVKALVRISATPQMDDHWTEKPTILSAQAVGAIIALAGEDTLEFLCSVPARSVPFIAGAVGSGKVRFVSVYGTRLKWRQGAIFRVSLSTRREEE